MNPKFRILETAHDDGSVDGVSGTHPAAGTGSDDTVNDNAPAAGLTASATADLDKGSDEPANANGRPEGIPEQFWTTGEGDEPGQVNSDAMVKSWKDTRAELASLKAVEGTEVPEKADAYVFTPPTETSVNYDNLNQEDPGMMAIREAAKEAGLSQKQFQTMVGKFFETAENAIPEPFDMDAEMAIVGKNGKAVLDANIRWAQDMMARGLIGQQEYEEFEAMGATGYGVRFLAKVRQEATGERPIPLEAAPVEGNLPSKEELHQMMGDPKYSNDAKFRADVDGKFEAVYGTDPAPSSERNMGISHMNTPPANIQRADAIRKKQGGA